MRPAAKAGTGFSHVLFHEHRSTASAKRYKRIEEQYDEIVLTRKIYIKGSESLQDWVKCLWNTASMRNRQRAGHGADPFRLQMKGARLVEPTPIQVASQDPVLTQIFHNHLAAK